MTIAGPAELVELANGILAAGDDMDSPWGKRKSLAMVDKYGTRARLFAGAWLPEQFENERDARLRSFAPTEWTQRCSAGGALIELRVRTGKGHLLRLQDHAWLAGSPLDTHCETRLRGVPIRWEVVRNINAALLGAPPPSNEPRRTRRAQGLPAAA